MTDEQYDQVEDMISELFTTYEFSYIDAIFVLDRLKHLYHKRLTEIEEENEDNTAKD